MARQLVLVAEDEPDIRLLLVETLSDAGYEVIQAGNGSEALEQAIRERPDVILLDVMMPVMDGFQVLKQLREDPAASRIPVIMLTALSAAEGEARVMEHGVSHYLNKPLDNGVLEATVRVVLRENARKVEESSPDVSIAAVDARIFNSKGGNALMRSGRKKAEGEPDKKAPVIRSADRLVALEQKLGGGIPMGSLTLLEGAASSGKSVLCQHLVFGALSDDYETAYFTSEHSRESLVTQMNSLSLNPSAHLRADRLRIFPVPEPREGELAESLLTNLAHVMESMPVRTKFIVLDSLTDLAGSSSENAVISFFTSCRRVCNKGRTLVVVLHSYAFGAEMFTRLRALCDNYLALRSETVGGKAVKTVEVRKVSSNNLDNNNMVSFEVVANMGMKVLPISKAKA